MPQLAREDFVTICTHLIFKTRAKICIGNQESGYLKYHREIKQYDYINREVRSRKTVDCISNHALIEHAGLGKCSELAQYLLVEIGRALCEANVTATLKVMRSMREDHAYLEICLKLKGEICSRWEIDAWDPRIIDISSRPNKSIKNKESLTYGYSARNLIKHYEDDCVLKPKNKRKMQNQLDLLSLMRKPEAGRLEEDVRPPRDVVEKHGDKIYPDYTLEKACASKMLDSQGKIHYLQRVSIWQKLPEQIQSPAEDSASMKRRKI